MLFLVTIILFLIFFFFNDTATTEIYTLSLHDALPIFGSVAGAGRCRSRPQPRQAADPGRTRSEEHTSELQSRPHLVCRLLLEKKKKTALNTMLTVLTSWIVISPLNSTSTTGIYPH